MRGSMPYFDITRMYTFLLRLFDERLPTILKHEITVNLPQASYLTRDFIPHPKLHECTFTPPGLMPENLHLFLTLQGSVPVYLSSLSG